MKKLLPLYVIVSFFNCAATPFNLTKEQLQEVGNKIWQRESNRSVAKLVWWNKNENCASLGIGHFIWFPARIKSKQFTETFPRLVAFLREKNVTLPAWLNHKNIPACPWENYDHFVKEKDSIKAQELRALLNNTIGLQAEFIVTRAERAMTDIIAQLPAHKSKELSQQLARITSSTQGIYALVDYINFKGEGTNKKEQYRGHGWGLKQVLEQMHGDETGKQAVVEFVHAAKKVLEQRVAHAKNQKIEINWLPGWLNRVDSYLR